ncbi:tetratricopeptide repeat protein [Massilia sp. METH4]|uniref:tetratricopeptide repeat protein n=1 Tax=Massilia sp. METH4 TaxID=3123041 RepID=UPI0030CE4A54
MSLINKMLQDLDARGGGAARNATGDVRPVAADRSSRKAIAIGAGVGALIVAIGGGGWYWLNGRAAAPVAPVAPTVASMSAPAAPTPPAVPAAAPAVAAPALDTAAAADPTTAAPIAAPAPQGASLQTATPPAGAPQAAPSRSAAAPAVAPQGGVPPAELPPAELVRAQAPVAQAPAPATKPRPRPQRPDRAASPSAGAPAAPSPPVPTGQGAGLTASQQAENGYRRALAALQEGRVTEGIALLEGTVQAYPRHEAARQTLVGLLVENGRADEAMRHAQLGLSLDANQPQLAMLLARLQLEHGGAADETLLRSLPHAGNNPDYLAFLAGVLQKQGRYREAAQQYEAALRLRPANGVWWMGLGMARQADNQRSNAREAYLKAREGGLTPELQAFVERRLGQLQ